MRLETIWKCNTESLASKCYREVVLISTGLLIQLICSVKEGKRAVQGRVTRARMKIRMEVINGASHWVISLFHPSLQPQSTHISYKLTCLQNNMIGKMHTPKEKIFPFPLQNCIYQMLWWRQKFSTASWFKSEIFQTYSTTYNK